MGTISAGVHHVTEAIEEKLVERARRIGVLEFT
jgi:hypothetical protein